jgi:AcrR family transcriptional regulator
MSDRVKRRRYESPRRREAAERTREAIIGAARTLFLDRGYALTTLEQVAELAGVATPTLYATFGNKRELLFSVAQTARRGDAGSTPLLERPEITRTLDERDPERQIALVAGQVRRMRERTGPIARVIKLAGAGDAEIAARSAQNEQDRLGSMTTLARAIRARGSLRPGLTTAAAADVLFALTSNELYELLVLDRGWSPARYEDWLEQQLRAALLG